MASEIRRCFLIEHTEVDRDEESAPIARKNNLEIFVFHYIRVCKVIKSTYNSRDVWKPPPGFAKTFFLELFNCRMFVKRVRFS